MKPTSIDACRWHTLRVSPKTVWSFVELVDSDGRVGVGEATLGGREAQMRHALETCLPAVIGHAPSTVDLARARRNARSLPEFTVVSALDQAICDLVSQQRAVSVSELLGMVQRDKVRTYANINRGIEHRTPEGFAARAHDAVADGFGAVKIAPFDEVQLYGDASRPLDARLLDAGMARIAAVRDAVGPNIGLMVDCHWRLNRAAAEAVLHAADALNLYWLECPVPETSDMVGTIRALRTFANQRGVRLAGCEEMSLLEGFMPFLAASAYDVLMPDVKYVGSMREMLRVAKAMERAGVAFSPHNPSGPVCHAASLHICALVSNLDRLELQYAETPLFGKLVGNGFPPARQGDCVVPRGAGLGVHLDPAVVRELSESVG
jgi:galactonate dehydratase